MHVQLKYIDVEGMRVVTNNSCVAEHIKSDKVEKVVTGGINIGDLGQTGESDNAKSIPINGTIIGTVGKVGNLRIQKPSRRENMCKSIVTGFARHNHEKHAMLATRWRRRSTCSVQLWHQKLARCTAHGTQQATGSVSGKKISKVQDISLGSARRIFFDMRRTEIQE